MNRLSQDLQWCYGSPHGGVEIIVLPTYTLMTDARIYWVLMNGLNRVLYNHVSVVYLAKNAAIL